MSYPPPPGTGSGTNSRAPHPSLPSRPPQSRASGFKPSFSKPAASAAPTTYGAAPTTYGVPPSTYGAPPASYGRAPGQTSYGAPPSTYSSPASYSNAGGYATAQSGLRNGPQSQNQSYGYYSQANQGAAAHANYGPVMPAGYGAPTDGDGASSATDYNSAGMAAQIAQWQSAYGPKDADSGQPQIGPVAPGADGAANTATAIPDPNEKKKTVYREGGGKKWQDDTLLEWDPAHLRLFVGNLAGETTDDSLLKAFSRWKSVQKARVIRDKRSTKSKGYGFVSFSDSDDFFQAAKEMNGKYIQSHPVVVRKANTEIKTANVKDNRNNKWKKKNGGGNGHRKNDGAGNKAGSGMGAGASGYEPGLAAAGGGITKPGQKTKNGLRLLG
ncbi:hypothetical protein BROUX41_006358 [Berkeleyomyces rouxiae]|uniref:uncharacterized protein n=1 Tax=Berkeleyomyces rouxiae TaxID=2035830 RepID=UPI003B779AD8